MVKCALKGILRQFGYEVHRVQRSKPSPRMVDSMETLLRHLQALGLEPEATLDVGANRGDWSRLAKRFFPRTKCFLIEPQTEMLPYLDQFCREFGYSEYFLVGAAASNTESTLTIWDDLVGSSFLREEAALLSDRHRRVPLLTIDSLVEQHRMPLPRLVKLDVQGYELEALRGATRLFGNTEAFIVEVSFFEFLPRQPVFHQVIEFMLERDYVAYDFPGFLRRPYDNTLAQADVCFVKREGFLRSMNRWN